MTKKSFLFLILVDVAIWAYPQTSKQFDGEVNAYPEAVEEMFRAVKSTEEEKALTATFAGAWLGGMFSESEQLQVIHISNAFLAKKARNIHYYALWRCMLAFKEPNNSSRGYDAWINVMDKLCQDRKATPTGIQSLMSATELLLTGKAIYSSPGNEWRTLGDDYQFDDAGDDLSVVFGVGDLACFSKGDSLIIEQTKGRYNVATQQWTGNGGTVTWARAGFEPSEVYAVLTDYTIDMKKSQYEADSVMFVHKTYFPAPVQGRLADKVMHNHGSGTAIFPEFRSLGKKYVFEEIYPNISFEGGLTIQGARTIGSGTDEEKAVVRIEKGDSLKFRVYSKNFMFRTDRVNAHNASLVMYLGTDSICHANLSFSYLVQAGELSFIRSDAASSQAPYTNSYHKTDMNFEQLIWKINEPLLTFSMTRGASMGRAEFRSQNYFNRNHFEQMQFFKMGHPLVQLGKCAVAYGVECFPIEVYAGFIKRPIADTRNQLIELAKQGFIVYDGEKDDITIQPVLHTYLKAAAKMTDFDVLNLRSTVNAPEKNATMDIGNYDLTIHGVQQVTVSDSQRVIITPDDRMLTLKQNRTMTIKGRIDAGQMVLYGDSLFFNYATFKIDLNHVDSLILYVPTKEKDAMGNYKLKKVKNVLQKMSGTLQVDQADNKSGRFSLHQYPILNSDSTSYVYYGASNIEGGAYDNEQFYFDIDPFEMDSIEHFEKEKISFPGRFNSADIFNKMYQILTVQPDYSLGFVRETGDSAITAYGNAHLKALISLSSKGLRASGQLYYLTATVFTEDFKMYPDSMNVPKVKEFNLGKQTEDEGTEFPEVHSVGNKIHWEPHNDKMHIYKYDKGFNMYNNDTRLDGDLLLTSDGLSGTGRVDMGIADIRSDNIDFRSETFRADTSLFRLRTAKEGPYQLVTVDSVRSIMDFTTREGQFLSVNDYALVRFPDNKFAAYIDEFTWLMDSAKVKIGADTLSKPLKKAMDFKYMIPGESEGIRYYSTVPRADSLNFVASSSTFDYISGRLKAEGVNLVKSANALIFPYNRKLEVDANGLLELSENARIVFNDSLWQHLIYAAKVNVTGRKMFTGSGIYAYVDEIGTVTAVKMNNIAPDKEGKIKADGNIADSANFMINPFYRYYGKISLLSDKMFPEFDGMAQIVQECETLHPEWFKLKSEIDPANARIEISEALVNKQKAKIYNGLFLSADSIYPAFFSQRRNYADNQLVQAHGVLYYDRDSMIYYIASEEKLRHRDTIGNLLALNRETCIMNGEGRISLGVNLGKVTTDAVGRITHNLNTKETSLDVMLAVDFLFDDGLAGMIASKIDSTNNLAGVDMRRPIYIQGLNEWLGMAPAIRFRRESSLGKVRDFPDALKHTLLLNQLHLKWDAQRRSFYSIGQIGVGNLFGHQVNRMMDGFVEISKRPAGDMIDIYLKLDDNNWFYFGYTRELMQIISSDSDFNERLLKLPEKQRKTEDKRPGYTYMIASADKYYQFLASMQRRLRMEGEQGEQEQSTPVENPSGMQENKPEGAPVIEIE
jgi:hypothetical protein